MCLDRKAFYFGHILFYKIGDIFINKGIVIKGNNKNSSIATFGSAFNKDVTLIPFIRVAFKELPIIIECKFL